MERITYAHLEARIALLNAYTNNPDTPYTRDKSGVKANVGNYHWSGAYGKYTLHQMHNESGGVSEPLSYGHCYNKRELFDAINVYMAGIKVGKESR